MPVVLLSIDGSERHTVTLAIVDSDNCARCLTARGVQAACRELLQARRFCYSNTYTAPAELKVLSSGS